jgi:hypothetical protein
VFLWFSAPPASGQQNLSVIDDIPFHLGRMYERTSHASAWEGLDRALKRLALRPEKRKPDDGVVVTQWRTDGNTRFQYHLFIPPRVEPARVYVGSVSTREERTQFNDVGGNNALFAAFEREFGTAGQSIPQDPHRRATKSLTFAPPDADVDCLRRLVTGEIGDTFSEPKEVSRAPEAPIGANFNDGRSGLVRIEGHLGEDGYFGALRLVEGSVMSQDLAFVALGRLSLARYRPGINNGCGVPLVRSYSVTPWR